MWKGSKLVGKIMTWLVGIIAAIGAAWPREKRTDMINSITGKLTVVDLRNVFWNGIPVTSVASVFIHANEQFAGQAGSAQRRRTAESAELEAGGVRVRRLK